MKKSVERRTGLSVRHATMAAIFVVLLLLIAEAGNLWNMLLRSIPWPPNATYLLQVLLDNCCGENTTKMYYQQKDAPHKTYANIDDPLYYNDLIYSDSHVSLRGGKYPMGDDCEALE